jgi:hypothetical protein
MPYLSQDSGSIPQDKLEKALEKEYTDRFYDGYNKGSVDAKDDIRHKSVNTVEVKKNRDVLDPYCLGYEIGYLKRVLWVLTAGKIT